MPSVVGMAKASAYGLVGLVMSALIAVAGLTLTSQDSNAATPPAITAAPTPTQTTTTAPPEPSTTALEAIDTDADFSVAAIDVDTGETLTYGDGAFDTASIVKVDILAALLHQAQQDGRALTASEKSLAAAMIERSDNEAATALFNAVGGKAGLDAFNDVIGLTETVTGSNGSWGLTQTTAADQLELLDVVFGDDAALKVGYLQRSATGLWDVTSIGEIEADGHTYLVAVLSDGNATFDSGVALVDQVAEAVVEGLS